MPRRGLHTTPAICPELVLDRMHDLDQGGIVGRTVQGATVDGPRHPHQATPFGDREAFGPVMTSMGAYFSADVLIAEPLKP